jgi:hypothetical protein
MKKIGWFGDLVGFGVIILLIILFNDFISHNQLAFLIAFGFIFINYLIIIHHERGYGRKNYSYKPYKSKKKVGERVLVGLLAGLHYLFFIGSYNHKKYNTQVWYPETLECVFGNISQAIIIFIYMAIAINLFKFWGYYSIFFMIIPLITTIVSIQKKK